MNGKPRTQWEHAEEQTRQAWEQTNHLNSIKQLLLAILIALILIVLGIWLPALMVLS